MSLMTRHSKQLLLTIGVYTCLIMFILNTNPDNMPLPLLVVPFILSFIAFYLSAELFLERFFKLKKVIRKRVSSVMAFLPVLVLILGSIGQLTVRDVLITAGFLLLFVFYFRKTDFLR